MTLAEALPTPAELAVLTELNRLIRLGHNARAAETALLLSQANPRLVDAHRLLGLALRGLGQFEGAEAALRAALALNPQHAPSAIGLGDMLVDTGRPEAAQVVLAPFVERADADVFILAAGGAALKAMGRLDEAAAVYQRARDVAPRSGVAEHNLAGVLGDMHRFADSAAATQRAFDKGLDAPETWLVRARALQGLGELDAAAKAFEQAIARRPAYADALGDFAQLIWMRTEDIAAAAAPLDRAISAHPQVYDLRVKKARLLEFTGDPTGAYEALQADSPDGASHPAVQVMAAHLASGFAPRQGLVHAQRAFALAPNFAPVVAVLAEAQIAAGEPRAAAATAEIMRQRWPLDQHGIALLAVAWRLLGDPRYRELYDYARFVGAHRLDTPDGWPDLGSYLADLARALGGLHGLRTHPVGQSLRHGTQTQQSLLHSEDPAIRAFFQAVDAPIRRHIAGLGSGEDPLRARIQGGYRFAGIWSVRLRPGGFHTNHVHQQGWLSSACYVALPDAIERGQEGWLTFGGPGVATPPPLSHEHVLKPEPGMLALFPSYMWHGTAPFGGDQPRLTIAFDLLPARA